MFRKGTLEKATASLNLDGLNTCTITVLKQLMKSFENNLPNPPIPTTANDVQHVLRTLVVLLRIYWIASYYLAPSMVLVAIIYLCTCVLITENNEDY